MPSTHDNPQREPGEVGRQSTLPRVFAYLPRCPRCGDTRHRVNGTRRHDDIGAIIRTVACRDCGQHFVIDASPAPGEIPSTRRTNAAADRV